MVNQRIIGVAVFVLAVIITYHWFYSHFIRDMLSPELIISFVGLFVIASLMITKIVKITMKNQPKYGYAIIGFTVLTTIHWIFVHFLNEQIVPELIISFIPLYFIGGMIAYKVIEITKK